MAKKTSNHESYKPSTVMSVEEFKATSGMTFGGELKLLDLDIGQACKLRYVGSKVIQTDLGEATSHMGEDEDGTLVSLPLAAIFVSNFTMAKIGVGDEFLMLREPDVTGKKGFAKGKTMENYAVKRV